MNNFHRNIDDDHFIMIFMIYANQTIGFETITLFSKLKSAVDCCEKSKVQWLKDSITYLYHKAGEVRDEIDLYSAIEKADKQELISKLPNNATSLLMMNPKVFTPSKTSDNKKQKREISNTPYEVTFNVVNK